MAFPQYTPPQLGPNPYQIAGQAATQLGGQIQQFGNERDKVRMAYEDMVQKRKDKILADQRAQEEFQLKANADERAAAEAKQKADLAASRETFLKDFTGSDPADPANQVKLRQALTSGIIDKGTYDALQPPAPDRFSAGGGYYEMGPDGRPKTIIAPKPDEGPTPQIIQTNEGVFRIDKATGQAIPVTGAEGPLGGKKALSPEDKRQARRTTDQSFQSLGRVRRDLQRVDNLPLWKVSGVYGANLPDLKGEEAASARSEIEGLKSKLATIALQNMREASKTGGAVGQVTDREWGFLAQSIANLDTERMTVGALKAQLDEAKRFIEESELVQRRAYKDAFGEDYQNPFENIPDNIRRPDVNPKADALRGKYNY